MKHHYKTCKNRGTDRIWIEGPRLSAIGVIPGNRFELIKAENTLLLNFASDAPTNKVSGKGSRPIVDLSGKWVSAFMDGANHYTATFRKGSVIIEPGKN